MLLETSRFWMIFQNQRWRCWVRFRDIFTEQEKQLIESIALPLLEQYFSNTELKDFYIPSDDEMHKIMNYIVGAEVSEDYVPMMLDEINLRPSKPIKNTELPTREISKISQL